TNAINGDYRIIIRPGDTYDNHRDFPFDNAFNVTTRVPVTGITGTPTTATAGTPLMLSGTVVPASATNKTIVWSVKSAGTTGATISGGNILNTTGIGTVTVRASIINGLAVSTDYTQDFDIAVSAAVANKQQPAAVTAIRSAQTAFNVVKGKTLTIPYVVDLASGETKAPVLTWMSDKPENVSVDQNGRVKGLTAGKSAKITIKSDNGQSKTFTVKVAKAAVGVAKISVVKPPKTMAVGTEKDLKVKVSPGASTSVVVKFSLDKKSAKYVTVDKAGKVTALKKGTAKITVKAGGQSTVVIITVK
ncbi:MAG: Ig-like domain-containing protein, partial [Firmicutes bacterium]|nr:Ig-like domain-containing protein [Bacillota bacterium]